MHTELQKSHYLTFFIGVKKKQLGKALEDDYSTAALDFNTNLSDKASGEAQVREVR